MNVHLFSCNIFGNLRICNIDRSAFVVAGSLILADIKSANLIGPLIFVYLLIEREQDSLFLD